MVVVRFHGARLDKSATKRQVNKGAGTDKLSPVSFMLGRISIPFSLISLLVSLCLAACFCRYTVVGLFGSFSKISYEIW
jgi:hypothetical protein